MSDSLQPHGLQLTRLPCPSPTPRVYSNSCPLSRWCHPTISSSVVPFSSCLQSFPASGPFQMSQFFTSGGSSIVQTDTKHQLKQRLGIGELNNICEQEGFFYTCLPSGRHPDLRQNLEAPVMSNTACQETEQGKSHRNSICVKFLKVFSRIFGVIFSLYSIFIHLDMSS